MHLLILTVLLVSRLRSSSSSSSTTLRPSFLFPPFAVADLSLSLFFLLSPPPLNLLQLRCTSLCSPLLAKRFHSFTSSPSPPPPPRPLLFLR
ncbi:hypothetical protein BDY24DRAFT_392418 [Mrakia frigida]|uniref:uncharacterized protein n=1 Tax=Mrakia frigida TaxID=29902 RepID=UPI003FCC25AB